MPAAPNRSTKLAGLVSASARILITASSISLAAEAAADIKRGLDDGVAREARRDRFEIGDIPGRAAWGSSLIHSGRLRPRAATRAPN